MLPNSFNQFITLNVLFLSLYASSELLYVSFALQSSYAKELVRKYVHLVTALLFWAATFFVPQSLFIILGLESIIAFFASDYLHIFRAAHSTREQDAKTGIYTYAAGIILLGILFYSHISLVRASILILGIADAGASIIGKKFPITAINMLWIKKSLGGSLVFFMSTLVILLIGTSLDFSFPEQIILAFALTLIELSAGEGVDNFLILLFVPLLYSAQFFLNCVIVWSVFIAISFYAQYRYLHKR